MNVLQTGSFLKSNDPPGDPDFGEAIVFITAHNPSGSVGFIINKKFSRTLHHLEEFKDSIAFPLHKGGPVETEKLYIIHRRPDLIEDGLPVAENIYSGGQFKQALVYLNDTTIGVGDIKIFIGYCGWDPGQLEKEIAEGSWIITEEGVDFIFTA